MKREMLNASTNPHTSMGSKSSNTRMPMRSVRGKFSGSLMAPSWVSLSFSRLYVEKTSQSMEHLLDRDPDHELDLRLGGEACGDLGEERRRHRGRARRDRLRQQERQRRLVVEPGERCQR